MIKLLQLLKIYDKLLSKNMSGQKCPHIKNPRSQDCGARRKMPQEIWLTIKIISSIVAICLAFHLYLCWLKPLHKKFRGNFERSAIYRGLYCENEWIYGILQQSFGKTRKCVWIRPVGFLHRIDPRTDFFGRILVQPGTVGQASGQKDITQKEIFEDDILRLTDKNKNLTTTGIVRFGEYGDQHFGWYIELIGGADIPQQLLKWTSSAEKICEVIGNVYENTDLPLPKPPNNDDCYCNIEN